VVDSGIRVTVLYPLRLDFCSSIILAAFHFAKGQIVSQAHYLPTSYSPFAPSLIMLIARVVGNVVSTIKDERLSGKKILIVREATTENDIVGKPIAAIDTVDAGIGDLVLIAQGSSARLTQMTKDTPTDAVIMAIIDELAVDGKVTFKK
jgi:microcompartment protein CcmK/EutM